MSEPRFDVIYDEHGVHVDYHFCRDWEPDKNGEMEGCYGTNPNHGFTFDEAKQHVVDYHKMQAEEWARKTYDEWAGNMEDLNCDTDPQ